MSNGQMNTTTLCIAMYSKVTKGSNKNGQLAAGVEHCFRNLSYGLLVIIRQILSHLLDDYVKQISLRGYCTSYPKISMFCALAVKIINTLWKIMYA